MNLENKIFFRVVNVAYVLSFPIYAVFSIFFYSYLWNEATASVEHTIRFSDWFFQEEQLGKLTGVIVIFPVYFSLVNLIKETLIYLAFGRKFEWKRIDILGYGMTIMVLFATVISLFQTPKNHTIKTSSNTMTKYFNIGQRVHHKTFGYGTVIVHEDMILRVRFEKKGIGSKSIMASYVE